MDDQDGEINYADYFGDLSSDGEGEEGGGNKKLREMLLGGDGDGSGSGSDSDDWRHDFDKSNRNQETEMIIKFNTGFQ